MIKIVVISLILAYNSLQTIIEPTPVQEISPPDLIGIWQDSPVLGSGFSDTYQFFPDGTYIFNFNQMDCAKTEIWHSGTWQVENKMLILEIKNLLKIENGELVKVTGGSCGSEFELINGYEVTIKIDPPKTSYYKLKDFQLEDKSDEVPRKKLEIEGTTFWQYSTNPEK